jgi:hypothetical protein
MKNKITLLAGIISGVAFLSSPAQAIVANAPHLHGSVAIPNNRNVINTTYRFYVHVQGASINQLSINLPNKVRYQGQVTITNQAGKQIAFTGYLNQQTELIKFNQIIEPNEILTINLEGIRSKSNLIQRTLFMPISVNENKIDAIIPIGTARIQLY